MTEISNKLESHIRNVAQFYRGEPDLTTRDIIECALDTCDSSLDDEIAALKRKFRGRYRSGHARLVAHLVKVLSLPSNVCPTCQIVIRPDGDLFCETCARRV